ncbi:MAG TPA: pyrroloquinoline quinone biosynthesis peptide chaperone PqqD [Thauera aminoaromatica]|uniref:pyrroloquinoline quinone biosynthesis peptide chaperone PqqD n=1 Tax=Accumulibacter sp. TaxID=2053492 RepID=UPI002BBFACAC|nr:pyrroloquinoline quinone biosynthesis peptide chaperone PqqD [Accumulibacter sp.]MBX3683515.1 pyrroloquinoline quinone biosynthesis peptide chaperone PqqD [Thauera sp.]HMW56821.1 pyrroloquinoline quinone biosynthesis peptide chaperone PqqD [Accumulibacter sp.]HNC66258.1 pyrroloquinoline quinone biosynthesis peptide chaperone PqqD [Thauera aminoaromatica]
MDALPLPADARPRLSPHYVFRWEESQSAFILLYPEGLIKLNASAGAILARCDGARTLATIIAELQASYPAQGAEIADGVRAFVDLACDKGWLRAA